MHLKQIGIGLAAAMLVLFLGACEGDDGNDGAAGAPGAPGAPAAPSLPSSPSHAPKNSTSIAAANPIPICFRCILNLRRSKD